MSCKWGLKRRDAKKQLRCEWQYKRDQDAKRKTILIVAITLMAVALTYSYLRSGKAGAKLAAKLDHTERLLASYMTVGAVQDADTIYTCAAKAYELPKGI